ncbi:ABC transporter ATP-binding protein [candidate division KSB1 bacterium]|nr:ABC transporter ATP-binding protein [candidate division KSB1 bacterium]NIR71789.1 ABC transporter ATP-binding protein [candidate division KSB1 bacterium]NIS25771.1 ABC transporter ATP-binding protein [candidate division KSB1 bacterium]NIT72640.1 ABC transporter ATP-binding protein [candidate division KSB1 bacterium]NIU26461.1 ABC transporter ATP-binding protein [candidate division KSB1 bacterium]
MAENSNNKKDKKPALTTLRYAFWNIVWPRRRLLLVGLVLIILNRLAGLVLPGASKFLVDEVIAEGDVGMLKLLLLAVGGAVLVQSVTSFALTRLLSVEAQHLISILRAKVQQHIIYLPVQYFDNTKSGELVSRIMTDVEGVRNLVGTGLVQLFGGILTSVLALIILININALLTLYVLLPLVFFGLITLKAFGYIRPIFRERGKINADVTGRLTESLGGIRVVKGFHAEQHEINVFKQGVQRLFENVKKSLTATSLVTSSATLLMGLASVGIMWIGGTMILEGNMTVGDLLAFILYLGFLIAPIVQMSNIGSQITEAFAGLDRTEEIMNVAKENEDHTRTIVLNSFNGDFKFEDVIFAYEEGNDVLKNISFEAPAGTMTALVGSSGSGKTTIAGLAASFLTPRQGTVRVDGIDLSKVTLDSYRSLLGVVLQDDFLYEGTIRENILFSSPKASEAQLLEAVEAAHVKEFANRFERGLDTLIGERGVKLSGGQRQRVAIARAILADPKVLILDEATSNLDTESELYIQESLAQLMTGRTTFVIAHRLSTIRRADQILVIEDGEILDRGTHDELIEKRGRYYQLYTYQARI